MTLRTHNSQYLRTSTEATGAGIEGDVTVNISVSATLTRERTIPTNVRTRVYPAATMEYVQPDVGDIIFAGFENAPQFGTLEVAGGLIVAAFEGFINAFDVPEDHAVGREFGVVEGWHSFDAFDNPAATFGDLELTQELFVSLTGFDGSEEQFGDQFMVIWDVTYDLDPELDVSGEVQFGDLEAFFGVVEDNWIEDDPTDPGPWGRVT